MKSLAKNSIYNVVYKCLNVVFPLLTISYVTRILSAEGIGKVSSAQNIASYFIIIAALGLPSYGTKKIAEITQKNVLNKTFTELFIINLLSSLTCSIVYYILIVNVSYFNSRFLLYFVAGLSIIFNILNVDWFYQGREEYKYIMLRSFIVKIISLISIFLFVRTKNDYIFYALIQTLASFFNYIFNVINLKKYVEFDFSSINLKQHMKPIFILLAASISVEIYTLADTTMLSFINGDITVGYYTTAVKCINIAKTVVFSISAVFLPRLSFLYANELRSEFYKLINFGLKLLLFCSIPVATVICVMGEEIILVLFGNGYIASIEVMQILSFSIITVSISGFIGNQVLITLKKENYLLLSTILGAFINIILNCLLIFSYKQVGAAIASILGEATVTLFQLFILKKYIKIDISKTYFKSIIVSQFFLIAVIMLVKHFIDNLILKSILALLFGGILYFIALLLTKNEMLYWFLHKFEKTHEKRKGDIKNV